MATSVMTLREYADSLDELASTWEGEQPVVLIGDVHGSFDVSEGDGYSDFGPVGFAHECFDGNGVFELGQKADTRFFGTMLFDRNHLADDVDEGLDADDGGEA